MKTILLLILVFITVLGTAQDRRIPYTRLKPIEITQLNSTGQPAGKLVLTDGANGLVYGTEVDGSVTNEIITATQLDGTDLKITEAGTLHTIDLSSLSVGGGGASLLDTLIVSSHGYAAGDVIDYNAKALASNADSANVIGIVYEVIDANTFSYQYSGVYTLGSWVVGMNYFLSTTVAGATADTTQLYEVGDVYLFLGTGVANGLLLEIDVGVLIGEEGSNDYFDKLLDDSGDIIEGTNLFYTEVRVAANSAVALNTEKISYTDAAAVALNTEKETNATHIGEVTGDVALTIIDDIVDAQNLKATNEPTIGYVPAYEAGGGFTWTEGGGGGSSYSGASVTTSVDRTINGTASALPFGSEEWDTNDYHDNTTNNTRITVSENGLYRILFNTNFDFLNSVAWYSFRMFKNGTQIREWRAGQDELWDNADYESVSITIDLNLTSSDYIEIKTICDRNTGAMIYSGDALFQIQKLQ